MPTRKPMGHSRRRAIGEIAAVVLTGAVFLIFENVLDLKLPFLAACFAAWSVYIGHRIRRDRRILRDWGFRRDTFQGAAVACAIFFVVAAIGMFSWRLLRGGTLLVPSLALLFLLYPVWSLLQQFFVQSLVAANLERLGSPRVVTVPVAALLFGLAHAPDLPLMALCAGAGLVWTSIYLRWPHLIPISLTHAWLGTMAYVWVLERNPWKEMNLG